MSSDNESGAKLGTSSGYSFKSTGGGGGGTGADNGLSSKTGLAGDMDKAGSAGQWVAGEDSDVESACLTVVSKVSSRVSKGSKVLASGSDKSNTGSGAPLTQPLSGLTADDGDAESACLTVVTVASSKGSKGGARGRANPVQGGTTAVVQAEGDGEEEGGDSESACLMQASSVSGMSSRGSKAGAPAGVKVSVAGGLTGATGTGSGAGIASIIPGPTGGASTPGSLGGALTPLGGTGSVTNGGGAGGGAGVRGTSGGDVLGGVGGDAGGALRTGGWKQLRPLSADLRPLSAGLRPLGAAASAAAGGRQQVPNSKAGASRGVAEEKGEEGAKGSPSSVLSRSVSSSSGSGAGGIAAEGSQGPAVRRSLYSSLAKHLGDAAPPRRLTLRQGAVGGSGDWAGATAAGGGGKLRGSPGGAASKASLSRRLALSHEATLKGHSSSVRALAVGPTDGSGNWLLATASWGSTIRVWKMPGPKGGESRCVSKLRSHVGPVYSLCFSQDGSTLFSAGEDLVVRVWHVPTAQIAATLEGHTGRVWCVTSLVLPMEGQGSDGGTNLSGSGRRGSCLVLSASEDRTVRAWVGSTAEGQGQSWRALHGLQGHSKGVNSVAALVCPELSALWRWGHRALAASGSDDGTIRLWSLDTWTCLRVLAPGINPGRVLAVAWAPDRVEYGLGVGHMVLSASADGSLRAWGMRSHWDDEWEGVAQARLPGGQLSAGGQLTCLSVSADGSTAVTGTDGGGVALWRVGGRAAGEEVVYAGKQQCHRGWVRAVAWSPDGSRLLTGGHESQAEVWRVV